jgi:hypothetical protein
MACSDAEECHVLCIFGRDSEEDGEPEFVITEPAVYRVERDAGIERYLLSLGERFVKEFVRPGIPPPVKPHANRREFKMRLTNDCGSDAVRRWEASCLEYASRETSKEASGGDGLR